MEITAAPTALRRLFVALLDNAVRFARSRVDVSVSTDMKDLLITVSDDGPGFSDEVKPRAFERFATAPRADAEPEDGSGPRHYGLGLALVAEVAAQHDGRVEIGAQASGALIVVRLPMIRQNRGRSGAGVSLFPAFVSRVRRMF